MIITPSFLNDLSLKPEEGKFPQISIKFDKDKFIIKTVNADEIISGESVYPVDGMDYLIFDNIPTPKTIIKPSIGTWTHCIWYSEKVIKSIIVKDWEALGINIDLVYANEREILQLNKKCDTAYAAARSGGAYGGYPSENKLFVICSSDKKDFIKTTVENAIRNINS